MKPLPGTYPAFYENYISKVKENDVVTALENNYTAFKKLLSAVPASKENYAYAPGKWTVKQLVNHLIDAERIFAYRALRFARRDPQMLASFEEDDYARAADVSRRNLADLVNEMEHVRLANIAMFKSFSQEDLLSSGMTGAGPNTALALGFSICGHTTHHMNVLGEKYL